MATPPIAAPAEVNDGSLCQCEDFGEQDLLADDEELQKAAIDLAKYYSGLDKYARRTEVIEARRQRFYRRGDQYIVWNPQLFAFTPYPDAGGNGAPGQDTPRYTDVYDIFWPYLRAQIAVGVQNPPGVNFEPDDPVKATDIAASRAAETFRFHVDRVNQRKKVQADVMSKFGTDGRTVIYTRNVRDAAKFGKDDTGQPNTVQLWTVYGVLETKCPLTSDEMHQWPYFFLSDEPDLNLAKLTYPQYAENIRQGTSAIGESAYERMARIGVLQGTKVLQQAGDAFAHLTTRNRVWFRPSAFEHAPKDIRDKFKEMFPDGMKLVTAGDAYCGAFNQAMDDHISVGWPAPGDGSAKPSMMKNMVPVQDAFNDYKNLEKEIFDFQIPVTYRDSELGDIEALREQTAEPGNNIAVTRPQNIARLEDAFYTEPPPNSPPSLINAYQDLRGSLAQFMTGAQPALFGGSDKDNDTASGIAMLRDQAMGQFSLAWGALQELFASAYKNAIICRAKVEGDPAEILHIAVSGKAGRSMVANLAVADLTKGNFHVYPDLDSTFPETTGSKRQTVTQLVTQAAVDPMAIEAYGIFEPENLEIQRELMGIHDWIIPGANSSDKQMAEIEILLKQRPVPNMDALKMFATDQAVEGEIKNQAAPMGIPLPTAEPDPMSMFKSSVQVDPIFDFHQFELKTVKNYLSSPEGIAETKVNKWGILNVKLHGLEHQAALAAQMPPPMAQPASPGGAAPNEGQPKGNGKAAAPPPGPMNQQAPRKPPIN